MKSNKKRGLILFLALITIFLLSLFSLCANAGIITMEDGDRIILCGEGEVSCTTSSGSDFYGNADYAGYENSITIDSCQDGAAVHPYPGALMFDFYEYVHKMTREDLNITNEGNKTDNHLRMGDTIKITIDFLCSIDGDSYSIIYKDNTNSSTSWELLASGTCYSQDYVNYYSQLQQITVQKKINEKIGNHTIRAIISYSSVHPEATCGSGFDDPYYSDTDDLIIEVIDKLDTEAPVITPITPINGERVEYGDGLIIPLQVNVSDNSNVSFVNATLIYNGMHTLLNLTRNGSIYFSNISNISNLGEYTLLFFANDTIATNSTLGTFNHIVNYNISFILKDDSSLTISKPQSFAVSPFKIYDSNIVPLEFKINDVIENLPFNEVYYILNGSLNNIKKNLYEGDYIETANSYDNYLNNSLETISQSFVFSKNMTLIDLSFLTMRMGDNLTNATIHIFNDTLGSNTLMAKGELFSNNMSFSWTKTTLNQSINIISGELYRIDILVENQTNFLLLGYNVSNSNISIRLYDAFNYTAILNASEGLNSITICENNTIDLICSFTQFKVDTTSPYLESIIYTSNVELGNLQTITIIPRDVVSQISSGIVNFNNTNYSMTKSGANYAYSFNLSSVGIYNFSIFFNDTLGWNNFSGNYFFNVSDTTQPTLLSISNYPNTTNDIDPNVTIYFNFTLYDLSNITDVKFQYRKNTTLIWENVTANSLGLERYNSNFTPDEELTYYYRVYATDIFNNSLISTQQNITVSFERTWTYSPYLGQYDDVFMNVGETKEIYNFTIINTGDIPLLFNLTSHQFTSLTLSFSNSSILIPNGSNSTLFVSSLAPIVKNIPYSSKSKIICEGCSPNEGIVGGNVIVQGEGPYIDIKLVYVNDKNSEETTDSNVYFLYVNDRNYNYSHKFRAKIENVGTMSAENISFSFNFTNTSLWILNITNPENLTSNFSLQALGQSGNKKTIDIIFLTKENFNFSTFYDINASTIFDYNGSSINNTQTIMINFSKYNPKTSPLGEICDNGIDDNLNAQVDEGCPVGGGGGSNNQDNTQPQINTGGAGGGGTGVGAGLGGGLTLTYNISVNHPKNVDLFRGTNKTIQINVTNPYKNKYFSSIKISLSGYYPNYMNLNPKTFDRLDFNETRSINITFSAPSYIGYSVNNIKISFEYFAVSLGQNESSGDEMSVSKDLNLIINEVSREDSMKCLEESSKLISNAIYLNYSIINIKEKFEKQKNAVFSLDFTLASKLCAEIKEDFENIKKYELEILQISQKINDKIKLGYSLVDAQKLLNLSMQQFSDGEYDLLENSLKDVETSYALTINLEDANINKRLYKFLSNNFKEILFAIVLLIIGSYFAYKKILKERLKQKIIDLDLEKVEIDKNLKDLQSRYYFEKSISSEYYNLHTDKNKSRIAKINQELLHNKSISLKFEKKSKNEDNLKDKELKIKAIMSDIQKQYYADHTIDKKSFDDMIDAYNEELSDTKKELLILKHKPKSKFSLFKGKVASVFYRNDR